MDDKPALDATQTNLILANLLGEGGPRITVIESLERMERAREKARRKKRRQQLHRIGRRRRKKIKRAADRKQ